MQVVELCVHLDCPGCQRKVQRALLKLQGVNEVDIDMLRQKVTVTGWVDQKKVLKTVRKTGRSAVLWPSAFNGAEYNTTSSVHHAQHHVQQQQQQQQPTPIHQLIFNVDTSSYNYYKHGYGDASLHQSYHQVQPDYSHIIADETRLRFSDDNPTACSVM